MASLSLIQEIIMNGIEEYLASLEGKDDLNPVEVARTMHELHNQEVTTRDAKIAELESEKTTLSESLAGKDQEIVGWKAKNFDLAMQLPGTPVETPSPDNGVDGSTITIADLFEPRKV